MMQFAFELKKILFSKKLLYVYLFIILGVVLLFVRNVTFQPYIEKEENERIGGLIEKSQSLNRMYTAALENNPEDEEMDKLRLINSSMLAKLYEVREIKSDKWKNRLPIENAFLKEALHFKEEGGDYDLPVGEINKMLAMNHKHLSENIKPRHATYSIALPNFLKLVVDLFMNFGAIIILVILVGEIMTSEFETHSINFLYTQPVNKGNIITGKFFSSILVYFLTAIVLIVATALVGLFGFKGKYKYPIMIEKNGEIDFITIVDYMGQGLTVISITSIMVIALLLVYSLLFKHTLATIFALLATLVAGYGLSAFIKTPFLFWFNPFQYLLPEERLLVRNGADWYQGIPVILLVTIVLFLIARKKIETSRIN
ncbi:ABC transporter permease subunit [Sporosarcina thermotolerans]|uniref:ABC transporter permease subunit n=1 Tax=Sporosarcina thermotolerans TaxID=633404 RepID=A0AAW9ACB8_9BACL|nr:ABC transporter permease subunit [Sporosarcina thermotolerans]MDW0118223.1 ABC transporter permease subunit [Sporosarcina thermotolerans]